MRSYARRSWLAVAVGGLFACSTASSVVSAAESEPAATLDAIQHAVQSVFEKCRDSVVRIEATDEHGYLSGTGFFIDPNGLLYTSYTVGGESQDIQVAFGGAHYPAHRLISDIRTGIAILKIDAQTPFLSFGSSRQLTVASPVIAIGYPMALPLTPAFGTVGGFDLKYQGRYFATTHIRANIAVQRGEGGAPLVNSHGEVIGILISRVDPGSAAYVLPIEAAEKIRKDFVRFREVRPGWIGVRIKPLEQPVDGSTALIEETLPDAPGQKAGLLPGDVIVQVGDHHITSTEDVLDASFFLTAEDETLIRVYREGSEHRITVMPVDNPDARVSTTNPPQPPLKIDR